MRAGPAHPLTALSYKPDGALSTAGAAHCPASPWLLGWRRYGPPCWCGCCCNAAWFLPARARAPRVVAPSACLG